MISGASSHYPPSRTRGVDAPDSPLSSPDVCRHLGITYRQLDWWVSQGYIPGQGRGRGSGDYRRWTPEQVERVREIREAFAAADEILRQAGLPQYFRPRISGAS